VAGLLFIALIAIVVASIVAWRLGVAQGRREAGSVAPALPLQLPILEAPRESLPDAAIPAAPSAPDPLTEERCRLVRSYAEEAFRLREALAAAQGSATRYRQLVVDTEDNAPPPLLDSPNAPDDLKLIVGVGPVLERMLQQLGVATYRQIARWSERDIDEFDAKLAEFPGRIRRDDWVTQARELHLSKYGVRL